MKKRVGQLLLAIGVIASGVSIGTQSATAAMSFDVVSSRHYPPSGPGGPGEIVGEVRNTGDQTAHQVRVDVNFRSSGNQLLGTHYAFTDLDLLAPGEKSPFGLFFEPPAGFDHYEIHSITGLATSAAPNRKFTTSVTSRYVDADGGEHLVGEIRSTGTTPARFVEAVFSFYDHTGALVGSESADVNTDEEASLEPGQTAAFDLALVNDFPAFVSYTITSQSDPPPDTTGSSTPAAEPSTSPTPAPTSSSQSSTASAPTLTAPTAATSGVLITVSGSANPGAQVELWGVTAPNATFTRVNTPTATADDDGSWTKTIRPLRNVNLQARVASAMSTTRFIAVQTDVIQSVAALAGCVVQVTGRVFEPKSGRPVYVRAVDGGGRTISLGTGLVERDGRFLLHKPYACGQTLRVYTVVEGDAVNRPGATGTQGITTRR